jgi:hypothetical protein
MLMRRCRGIVYRNHEKGRSRQGSSPSPLVAPGALLGPLASPCGLPGPGHLSPTGVSNGLTPATPPFFE